jgi:hypothetical protein
MSNEERLERARAAGSLFESTVNQLRAEARTTNNQQGWPDEARRWFKEESTLEDGYMFLLRVPCRKGRIGEIIGTQSGKFWPMLPSRGAGMGTAARNKWAAKEAARIYTFEAVE